MGWLLDLETAAAKLSPLLPPTACCLHQCLLLALLPEHEQLQRHEGDTPTSNAAAAAAAAAAHAAPATYPAVYYALLGFIIMAY